ncbi:MAG: DUF4331 domain-containing protein [Luteimonas sp.]
MKKTTLALAVAGVVFAGAAFGSSHREAPGIAKTPKVDGTDLYMFRSYETGRTAYTTILANYIGLEDAYSGPNFNLLDPNANYEIHIDNNGDALPDLTFRFQFQNIYRNIKIPVNGVPVAVPLSNIAPFSSSNDPNLNVLEAYTVDTIQGTGAPVRAKNVATNGSMFIKPFDNIGQKSVPQYAKYAETYISQIRFPNCLAPAKVFVSQRKDGFSVALGKVFDLLNLNPLGAPDANHNDLADKNVTTIALEVPTTCLTQNKGSIIGAWTTSSLPDNNNVMKQVSRLGMPLVNELIIGLPDKDRFNASEPKDDGQFATYVTNPTLPALIQALFPSVQAPTKFPRTDLVAAFLTGVAGLNQPANVTPSEMLRLNTAIAPKTAINQQTLGVLAGDTAGFPNGRRPGDDVVDIELRVAMGVLLSTADAPSGQLPYTDGSPVHATDFRNTFPYLNTPLPGAVN